MNDFNNALTLSMEQQFQMQVYKTNLPNLSPDQKDEILIEATRQLMLKDNIIKHLMSGSIAMSMSLSMSLSDFET